MGIKSILAVAVILGVLTGVGQASYGEVKPEGFLEEHLQILKKSVKYEGLGTYTIGLEEISYATFKVKLAVRIISVDPESGKEVVFIGDTFSLERVNNYEGLVDITYVDAMIHHKPDNELTEIRKENIRLIQTEYERIASQKAENRIRRKAMMLISAGKAVDRTILNEKEPIVDKKENIGNYGTVW